MANQILRKLTPEQKSRKMADEAMGNVVFENIDFLFSEDTELTPRDLGRLKEYTKGQLEGIVKDYILGCIFIPFGFLIAMPIVYSNSSGTLEEQNFIFGIESVLMFISPILWIIFVKWFSSIKIQYSAKKKFKKIISSILIIATLIFSLWCGVEDNWILGGFVCVVGFLVVGIFSSLMKRYIREGIWKRRLKILKEKDANPHADRFFPDSCFTEYHLAKFREHAKYSEDNLWE